MASGRTALTEIATALGCLGIGDVRWGILQRPSIVGVSAQDWTLIETEMNVHASARLAEVALRNGVAFMNHAEGLRGRAPRYMEWTGGRRPPGDEVIPADLRADRVFSISCKYLSKIVLNSAPGRLFDGLLQPGVRYERADWYTVVAPDAYIELVRGAEAVLGLDASRDPLALQPGQRLRLKQGLRESGRALPTTLLPLYRNLAEQVSQESARRWITSVRRGTNNAERLLWRLLRLASATYFVLGVSRPDSSMRLRIDTPWDWRQRFELRAFDIEPDRAGQPQVRWSALVHDRVAALDRVVAGHVEVRWSHGRFGGPPEAKVYLDTAHADVPGYVTLD